jgi:hypothetical protein
VRGLGPRASGLGLIAAVISCAVPPEPRPPLRSDAAAVERPRGPTEACVRRFVATQPLPSPKSAPDLWRVPKHGGDARYYLFDVEYGAPEGCGDKCNPSYAYGVALSCDRIGWYRLVDNSADGVQAATRFALRPTDTVLFDTKLWEDAEAAEFLFWLADDPAAPAAVRKEALARQPEVFY